MSVMSSHCILATFTISSAQFLTVCGGCVHVVLQNCDLMNSVFLSGYGQSTNILEPEHNADFLAALISVLKLTRPVIVSPSMSGAFSLPYLFDDPVTSTERAVAYVPVAPILTSKFVAQFQKSQVQ